MRRRGWKPTLLGALGAVALLAGCEGFDGGRRSSLTASAETKQGVRTGYPPPTVASPLGTGQPLRVSPGGEWTQGTYAVDLGASTREARED